MAPRPVLLAALLLAAAPFAAVASPASDSLRYVLDADATAGERARALGQLAQRMAATDPALALSRAADGVSMAMKDRDPRVLHEALRVQRDLQGRLGLVAEHAATTLRMLGIAKGLGDAGLLSDDLQELSVAYRASDRMEQAVEHARQAVAIAAVSRNDTARARAERFLMEALLRAGRHDELARLAEQALGRAKAMPPAQQGRLQLLRGRSLMALGRPADALPYLANADRLLADGGRSSDRFDAALELALCHARSGRPAEAERHLRRAEDLSVRLGRPATGMRLLEARQAIAVAKGDWRSAHGILSAIRHADDSLQRSMRDLALSGMLAAHELDDDQDARAALAQRAERSEAQVSGLLAGRRALLAALGLLLLAGALLVLLARRQQQAMRRLRRKKSVIDRQKEELRRQNLRLSEALMRGERQDVALGEMHHRLKNNLQAIDALLQMECGALHDPEARRLLRSAQGRLRAMALVHQTIYRTGDESALALPEHLEKLARNVLVAHGRHDRVSAVIQADEVRLSAADVLPLTLLVNELLTNSLKHSIGPEGTGTLRLVLKAQGGGIEMLYGDDGTAGGAAMGEGSFGLALMHALAAQLNGSLQVQAGPPLVFRLALAPDSLALRKAS